MGFTNDQHEARNPCSIEWCQSSAEEHHRVNMGLLSENGALKVKARHPDVADLSALSDSDLLDEVARRMREAP